MLLLVEARWLITRLDDNTRGLQVDKYYAHKPIRGF